MSIFKNEKELIEEQLLNIMNRQVETDNKWLFTVGRTTYVSEDYIPEHVRGFVRATHVSFDKEYAVLVNMLNALHERTWLIDYRGMIHTQEDL